MDENKPKQPKIINEVRISGRLVRDPETKYLPSGMVLTKLTIASNRRWHDKKNDQWKDDTTFVDVTTWSQLAEQCAEHFRKGANVIISGRLKSEKWEQNGVPREKVCITADSVEYHGEPSVESKPAPTGQPSDGLNFSGAAQDDIPF